MSVSNIRLEPSCRARETEISADPFQMWALIVHFYLSQNSQF